MKTKLFSKQTNKQTKKNAKIKPDVKDGDTAAARRCWSKEEDDKVQKAVQEILDESKMSANMKVNEDKVVDLDIIANKHFPLKTAVQCFQRYNKKFKIPPANKQEKENDPDCIAAQIPWSNKEVYLLKRLICHKMLRVVSAIFKSEGAFYA